MNPFVFQPPSWINTAPPAEWLMRPDESKLRVKLSPVSDEARAYYAQTYGRPFPYPFKLKRGVLPVQPYQASLLFKDQDFYEELTPDELEALAVECIALEKNPTRDAETLAHEHEVIGATFYTADVASTMVAALLYSPSGRAHMLATKPKLYRIRHIRTGLFYRPAYRKNGGWTNLAKRGKLYERKPSLNERPWFRDENGLTDLSEGNLEVVEV